jgi:hypothetical protein
MHACGGLSRVGKEGGQGSGNGNKRMAAIASRIHSR